MAPKLIASAENQLQGYKEVKSDLDTKMMRVHEAVEEVQKTISSNLFDKAGKAGYLTQKEVDYLACLKMKHVELE